MVKNRITQQEFDERKAELCQKWYSLMGKDAELWTAIAAKRAERETIGKELEKVEKEYNELVGDFDEPGIFGETNGKTKR